LKKLVIVILVLAVVAAGVYLRLRKPKEQFIAATDRVAPAMLVSSLRQTGVIKPQVGAMIAIGARATGTLEEVRVKVGDTVKAGQLVARIDSRAIQQGIKQATDTLNKTKLDLNRIKTLHPLDVNNQKNTIKASKSSYEYLKGVYEREKALFDKGFSKQETLDKTHHDMVSALSDYNSKVLQLDYKEAEYKTNVLSLNAEISRQESLLEEQKIQLTYTEIYSPIDGVVVAVSSVEGETVVAGLEVAKLITVFRPELLEMFVYIDESDVGKVAVGMSVSYTVDTYPGREFKGNISRINLQSETKDNIVYYVAIVEISKEDAILLRPEMTTNVRIVILEQDTALTVNSACLKWENGEQVVYKVIDREKNLSERVVVSVGIRGEDRLEIKNGLVAGDEVVLRFDTANNKLSNQRGTGPMR
jgi:multidrug efflux pump subunit AcrA (membrane-fusion protein)